MSLPEAPISETGFFVTHFLTVADQAKSKEFYVGVLGGKVVKEENPAISSCLIHGLFSTPVADRRLTSPRLFSILLTSSTG
jgi:catechol 2,3-dioxygenase-like lactoylglutathione lyase family enzyme